MLPGAASSYVKIRERRGAVVVYRSGSVHARFLSGEREASLTVAAWVQAALSAHRFRWLGDERTDVQQEALRRVFEALSRNRFDEHYAFKAYVQTTARYTGREALVARLRGKEISPEERTEAPWTEQVEQSLSCRDLVRQALGHATEDCRRLFTRYFFDQLSYAEIAVKTGSPAGTVKSRLFRCLRAAQHFLQRQLARR